MKKVLFMIINMNVGGTEKALLNMISEMSKEKFNITILMLENYGGFLGSIPNYVNIEYFNKYNDIKELVNNPPQQIAKKLIKKGRFIKGLNILIVHILSKIMGERRIFFKYILRDCPNIYDDYDIAVAYAGPMDFISYFILNKVKAKKRVQWIHFDVTKIGLNKKFAKKVYGKFDKIFVVSKEGRDRFIKLLPDLEDRVDTFFNIISSRLILEQANETILFEDDYEGIRILTVGRLTQEKGQDLCIEALRLLKDHGYNVRWYCVGDGLCKDKYKELVIKNKLQNDFIFEGSRINPYTYMSKCDIYVQPSRHEGYCITLAEARCFNSPIVTTRFTGANEQIKHEVTGLVCDISVDAIYEAIKRLLDDKDLFNYIKSNLDKEIIESSNDINKLNKLIYS